MAVEEKSRIKKWLWKFFLWQFEFKIKRVPDEKKILFLANRLFDEVEKQGYETKSTDAMRHVDISYYLNTKSKHNFAVQNIINHWQIDGLREQG